MAELQKLKASVYRATDPNHLPAPCSLPSPSGRRSTSSVLGSALHGSPTPSMRAWCSAHGRAFTCPLSHVQTSLSSGTSRLL